MEPRVYGFRGGGLTRIGDLSANPDLAPRVSLSIQDTNSGRIQDGFEGFGHGLGRMLELPQGEFFGLGRLHPREYEQQQADAGESKDHDGGKGGWPEAELRPSHSVGGRLVAVSVAGRSRRRSVPRRRWSCR